MQSIPRVKENQVKLLKSETKQDPVEPSQVTKPFHGPHFFFVGRNFQSPRPTLSPKEQIQMGINQRSEEMYK